MPMTRAQGAAHVLAAEQRFRVRLAPIRWWCRNEIAAAVRALGMELEPIALERAEALRELAALLEVPRDQRPDAPPPSSSRPFDRYSMPPDKEGDEPLLERMAKFRRSR